MESFKFFALIVTVLFTGLSAGLCFTWTNTVTKGIGALPDVVYLQSFQQMNRAILNPTFFLVFFAPFFIGILNAFLYKGHPKIILFLLLTATLLYFFGVVVVTLFGNVPLNEMLDKTDVLQATTEELYTLRQQFEVRWNQLHLIRTTTSLLSFLLLVISLYLSGKHTL
ncbi:anthrone oxygenase family protein [Flavobacterium litorale]|uniref:DUF1772 domain-containing protein n=1 Tax=Flavobacterium litorale TaxID=2856519 RepID=A0ABX8V9L7_9FLAO|nr:DUF1772 domain-containing protein [Flavobacterium litorale]QYJ68828.1 DUF1772 domain-containing protein [Flavobacterium litorale]